MQPSHTWVCVADEAHARIYRCDGPAHTLEPVLGVAGGDMGAGRQGGAAARLGQAAHDRRFDHLVLVGPRAVLEALANALPLEARQKLVSQVDRDLSGVSPRSLAAQLRDVLPH